MPTSVRARNAACIALLAVASLLPFVVRAADLERYLAGDRSRPTPDPVTSGLLLLGGGERDADSLRWFFAKAGHGHVVVLRASQAGEIGEEFLRVGGVASVETFVFSAREQADDPRMLDALARADAIFVAGGDQARYVRFWRDTPVARAIDAHVAAGRPLGGTSAGLAILGEYLYGAMDGGSLTSRDALADPFGPATTIESGFLNLAPLRGILTDSHFAQRGRLGRLMVFVAAAQRDRDAASPPIHGLGIDEGAALTVEPDGTARVLGPAGAAAWVVDGTALRGLGSTRSLQGIDVRVTVAGRESRVRLPEASVDAPVRVATYAVRGRRIVEVAPQKLPLAPPPP